jgi:hypothetical protein
VERRVYATLGCVKKNILLDPDPKSQKKEGKDRVEEGKENGKWI